MTLQLPSWRSGVPARLERVVCPQKGDGERLCQLPQDPRGHAACPAHFTRTPCCCVALRNCWWSQKEVRNLSGDERPLTPTRLPAATPCPPAPHSCPPWPPPAVISLGHPATATSPCGHVHPDPERALEIAREPGAAPAGDTSCWQVPCPQGPPPAPCPLAPPPVGKSQAPPARRCRLLISTAGC